MKLILAVVRDSDSDLVTQAFTSNNFRVTRIASTGGLLRRGVTTLMAGVEDDQVDSAIQLIRDRTTPAAGDEKRATVFVIEVQKFMQV